MDTGIVFGIVELYETTYGGAFSFWQTFYYLANFNFGELVGMCH